jgi:tetratricopeptide (TPR) repeat protein
MRRTLAPFLVAFLLGACSADGTGIRRVPEPQRVTEASARAAEEKGDWGLAASSWYELYLRGGDDAPTACVQAVKALCKQDEYDMAQKLVETALERDPKQVEYHECYANVLMRAGFRRAAEPHLERALELDPGRISALFSLAKLRLDLGLEAGATPLLERRIALGGGDAETWVLLARARRAAGQYPGCVEAYRRAFELGENDPSRLAFAASLYFELPEDQRGGLDAALCERWLRRAVEVSPSHVDAHFLLGLLQEREGRNEDAIASYRRALESDPAARKTLKQLAELYRRLGELEPARTAARRYVELERQRDPKSNAAQVWFDKLFATDEPAADQP